MLTFTVMIYLVLTGGTYINGKVRFIVYVRMNLLYVSRIMKCGLSSFLYY